MQGKIYTHSFRCNNCGVVNFYSSEQLGIHSETQAQTRYMTCQRCHSVNAVVVTAFQMPSTKI